MLAGTDQNQGGNSGGSVDNPTKILNVDYITSADISVSADNYVTHKTVLQIALATTTADTSIYFKAIAVTENEVTTSKVHYYYPIDTGITITDISNLKESQKDDSKNNFADRDTVASQP